jgi:hypothetical protein
MEDSAQKFSFPNRKRFLTVQNLKHLQEKSEKKSGAMSIQFTKIQELGTIVFLS